MTTLRERFAQVLKGKPIQDHIHRESCYGPEDVCTFVLDQLVACVPPVPTPEQVWKAIEPFLHTFIDGRKVDQAIDALLALCAPPVPTPEWCAHLKWLEQTPTMKVAHIDTGWVWQEREGVVLHAIDTSRWTVCPICGTPRPKNPWTQGTGEFRVERRPEAR